MSTLTAGRQNDSNRAEAIDGLRALAVASVIAFHMDIGFGLAPAGFVGVDIFFAISGYVIALSLSNHTYDSTVQYVVEFYKRRLLRLMPALIVCLLVVGVLSQLFFADSWLSSRNNLTGFFAFFGLSNFALLSEVDGYFNHRSEFNPFLHTWSLAVEEQFYVFFPLLLLPWLRRKKDLGIRTKILNRLVLIVGLASLAWAIYESSAAPQSAFFMLGSRFWELAAGAILFQYHSTGRLIPDNTKSVRLTALLSGFLILISIIWADANAFPFPWALVPIAGTLGLISAARSPVAETSFVIRLFKQRPVVYLGRCSYSLYLWHWPIVVFFRWTVGFDTAIHAIAAVTLTLVLGILSYHFIERPFFDSKPLRRLPARLAVRNGGAITVGLALGFLLVVNSSFSLSVFGKEGAISKSATGLFGHSQTPSSSPNKRTLWVLGDSHAAAYGEMLREVTSQTGIQHKIVTVSGCSIASLRAPYPETDWCNEHVTASFDKLIRNFVEGDIVFLASFRGQRVTGQLGKYESARLDRILQGDNSYENQQALEQSRELVEKLLSAGFIVVIDTPKPVFRAPLFRCSDWFNRINAACSPGFKVSAKELADIDAPVHANFASLKAEFPAIEIWDPFPILCPNDICSAFRDGTPMFHDRDHLSRYGNQLLTPSFVDLLKNLQEK